MPTDVETLMEMGFPRNKAEKALFKTGYKSVQVAMDWLFSHEGDADIDEPFEVPKGQSLGNTDETAEGGEAASGPSVPAEKAESGDAGQSPAVAKSLKCEDCGRLLKSATEAEVHAHRTGHANFSESTEEIKPLTAEEKEAQRARLQEKIKEKRVERELQEKEEQRKREKTRRTMGKDMTEAKQKQEELEMKKLVEQRRREKQEEKIARQRVKDQIEKDKIDRAAKFGKANVSTQAAEAASAPAPPAKSPTEAVAKSTQDYENTRLQIRLTNGQALTQSFGAKEPLSSVRLYIQLNRTDGEDAFKLMTSFPRKEFSEQDMDKPLQLLGLVPSAVLIVTKSK